MPENIDLSLLDPILARYEGQEDALITMLQEIQGAYGYLSEAVLVRLSRETKIPLNRIYGVVTFYAQFYLTPRGKNMVRACQGTACHVRGSSSIIKALSEKLGIKDGETTKDLNFSLETVACLGTCFLAPVMMVNHSYFGKLDSQKAVTIIDSYIKPGRGPDDKA